MQKQPAPSAHQQAVLEQLGRPGPHLVVHATAGAGKTTLLVQVAGSQPPAARQLFLAFARDAAQELRRRLPPAVETRTVHSLGRLVLADSLRRRGVELRPPAAGKYRDLALKLLREQEPRFADPEVAFFLQELAVAVRLRLLPPADLPGLERLIHEAGFWLPVPGTELHALLRLLPPLLERGLAAARSGSIDFTDMLYVPVAEKLPLPSYDLVSVDEAQDYSAAALELTASLAASGARLVFVGDPRQSIFGFAGADPAALERVREKLAANVMPLSVTWRCPRLHVELARQLAPEIEAAPGSPGGSIGIVSETELLSWVRPGDLVICRLNAPLVSFCLRLLAAGHRAFVRGLDLKARLQQLARRVFRAGFSSPGRRLRAHVSAELARLAADGLPTDGPAAGRLRDEAACLQHFLSSPEGCPDLEALFVLIDAAFREDRRSIVLSSIHRAKGQEADRVALLQPELLPAPYARSETALAGEACVQFVALTRARRELVFTEPPPAALEEAAPQDGAAAHERVSAVWQNILRLAAAGRRSRRTGNAPGARQVGRTRLFQG